MYKVYGDYQSGNCYKVKLMLSLLGRPYEWHPVDILKGETETPAFLAMNPNGKVPKSSTRSALAVASKRCTTVTATNARCGHLARPCVR